MYWIIVLLQQLVSWSLCLSLQWPEEWVEEANIQIVKQRHWTCFVVHNRNSSKRICSKTSSIYSTEIIIQTETTENRFCTRIISQIKRERWHQLWIIWYVLCVCRGDVVLVYSFGCCPSPSKIDWVKKPSTINHDRIIIVTVIDNVVNWFSAFIAETAERGWVFHFWCPPFISVVATP